MIKTTATLILTLLLSLSAHGQTDTFRAFGDYKVYFSVFNSSFLTPEVAALHGFTRGSDRAIVNIALTRTTSEGESLGLKANISGTAQNLIRQYRPLNFVEIREGDATYYLAQFNFNNEEPLHFSVVVDHDGTATPHEVRFTRTLFRD